MRWSLAAAIIFLLSQLIALPTLAGARKTSRTTAPAPVSDPLDRVALAVDGAESSHGDDAAMWRPDPSGPQGPMQVSEAAANDVGGGDRFDTVQNRQIGRAYLALLHRRYGDWPDAIAAYNWGIGNLEAWVKAGRPVDSSAAAEVASYLARVLHESGVCAGAEPAPARQSTTKASDCAALVNWRDSGGRPMLTTGATKLFYSRLDNAMALAVRNARMQ
jgi:hypothetical protein